MPLPAAIARCLRAALPLLVAALSVVARPATAGAASMRFVILPVDDQAGLGEEDLATIRNAVRGAILDRTHIAFPVTEEALPPGLDVAGCERLCQYKVSQNTGAEVVIVIRTARFGGGVDAIIEAWSRYARGPAGVERASAPDVLSLSAMLLEATDRLLNRLPQPPPPPRMKPPRQPDSSARRAYTVINEKSGTLAFILEFFLPSAGLFYDEAYGAAGGTLAAMVGGMVLLVMGLSDNETDSTRVAIGVTMVLGSRLFGLVAAPLYASSYNSEQRKKLMYEQAFQQPRRARLLEQELSLAPKVHKLQLTIAEF